VTPPIEIDSGLKLNLSSQVLLVLSLLQLSERVVEVGDVRLMMLLVMSLHDLTTDGRLQGTVVIGERRERIHRASGGGRRSSGRGRGRTSSRRTCK